jgi:glutaredoxin
MAIKLHRCGGTWIKTEGHPCWRVQKALDDQGIEYELVKHPSLGRRRRKHLIELTGQDRLPVLELEDSRIIREQSQDMVTRIRNGEFGGTAA